MELTYHYAKYIPEMIKFALIKERKTPPDRRVVFSPEKLQEIRQKFPEADFKVESSDIRIFSDEAYRQAGFEVSDDVSDCEVMLGVKEVPLPALIPNKKYFFFSHTIKKQPYNRDLLREILNKNIELYDHEVIVKGSGARLIGFGRYAGLVGAYNGFRGIGLKEGLFELPKAENLPDLNAMCAELDKIRIPRMKIVLTGSGKVARGAKEILDHMKIKEVNVNEYLEEDFDEPVYCRIDVLDYNKRRDGKVLDNKDFYKHPEEYESDFMRFARQSDMFIAGHFYGDGAPAFFTAEDAKSPDFKIKYIADISCDIHGPVASTIRPSTIAEPFYGYDAQNEMEVDFREKDSILVMAVDNLPCELPKDASEGFGEMFLEHVIPAFFNDDIDGVLKRAKMTSAGKLTVKFDYLEDYVKGEPIKQED
ncbi:Alanine dehydrogenase [Salegentibacter flavus]|uniref:Alanine dehydrogenase n=2 Tax=Salegentibacter flavus TaxID=287099 RepID=A0A1I5C4G6_9FLAO|nr:Alanine dehydrogenase [Salegentibacter flavus]